MLESNYCLLLLKYISLNGNTSCQLLRHTLFQQTLLQVQKRKESDEPEMQVLRISLVENKKTLP